MTTVLVTAVGGGVGEQVLKALRLADGYRIVGADLDAATPNFGLVDEAVLLPRADHPEYVDAVLAVAGHFGVEAVFYGSEPELRALSGARNRLADAGLLAPMCPAEVIDTCMDKLACNDFLAAHDFAHPRAVRSAGPAVLDEVDWYPVVVKPYRGSGGSRDVHVAQTRAELEMVVALAGTAELMVQEYVGHPDQEYTVGVLHDVHGEFINSIALHRRLQGPLHVRSVVPNRTGRSDLGDSLVVSSGISHGYVDRFPEVTATCERIAAALGATGPINLQCRLVDGEVYVFEINPRFSGTTSLRALMGYNEPDVLVRRHLHGEDVGVRFPYGQGLVLRSLAETVLAPGAPPTWREL